MLRGALANSAARQGAAVPRAKPRGREILAALAIALCPAIATAQTDAGLYRAASELNIRSAPSITAELIGVIPADGRVAVSGCDTFGWCEIRYGDIDGWAARQFLVRTGDLPEEASGPATALLMEAEPGTVVELAGIVAPGVPCATLHTDEGAEHAVLGNAPFSPGDALRVLVEVVATDACGGDTALAVLHVRIDR